MIPLALVGMSYREAPSAVSVVTAAEIRAHGYRTIADVLRSLPSFYVTEDRRYSYVGVRGFNRPGDYGARVLLLLDGLRTNDNLYDELNADRDVTARYLRLKVMTGDELSLDWALGYKHTTEQPGDGFSTELRLNRGHDADDVRLTDQALSTTSGAMRSIWSSRGAGGGSTTRYVMAFHPAMVLSRGRIATCRS